MTRPGAQLPLDEPCLACRTGAHRACAAAACPCRAAAHGDPQVSPPGPDPAVNAARALAACIAAYRDLLADDGFAAVLPCFEALRVTLPDPADVTVPGPRRAGAVDVAHPLDRSPR